MPAPTLPTTMVDQAASKAASDQFARVSDQFKAAYQFATKGHSALRVMNLVAGLALDRAALSAMRSTTRALRVHSPVLQARSPVSVAAGAVEVTTAVPLTSATFVASDAAASEWSGDLIVVPLWQAAKGERPTLGPSAQALDDKVAGAVADLIADAEFEGKAGASAVVALPRGLAVRKVAIVGLGNQTDYKVSGARKFGDVLATLAKEQKSKQAAALVPDFGAAAAAQMQQAAFEAAFLGLSPDTRYKSEKAKQEDAHKPPPLESLTLFGARWKAPSWRAPLRAPLY